MTFPLAPYAARPENSLGRRHPEPPPYYRSEYQRDRDRITHSAALRRLEYKTQVFVNHEGDMLRTRLTHSLEVAQIARSVARALSFNEDLTEAIALAHDLGHAPFGHAGQEALNQCMQGYGIFEHNLQSLRVVDALEERYAEFQGLNLTFETREGILKHCSVPQAKELGELGLRFLHNTQPSLEAQLVNIADELAYNNHDLDDGLRAQLLHVDRLRELKLFNEQYTLVIQAYPSLPHRRIVHETVRRMINRQVVDLIESSREHIARVAPTTIQDVRNRNEALIHFSETVKSQSLDLKRFLRQYLYCHYRVARMAAKARRILRTLFEAFMEDSKLLPPEPLKKATNLEATHGKAGRARAVADYIAGMTDRFAIAEHKRLFGPAHLT